MQTGAITSLRQRQAPPHDLAAEASLLGAALLSRDVLATVVNDVDAADFYKPTHREAWAAMMRLYERGQPIDPVTVADELRRVGMLEQVGGQVALLEFQAGTPSTSNAPRYARIVAEAALLRRLLATASEITSLANDYPTNVDAALDEAEAKVFALRRDLPGELVSLTEGMRTWYDELDEKRNTGGAAQNPTGFRDLDEVTNGLPESRLTVIAARPGMGKSSFANAVSLNVARHRRPVLFVSLEMAYQELMTRWVASESGLDGSWLQRGRIGERDMARVDQATSRLHDLPIEVFDNGAATLLAIRAAARRTVTKYGGLGLVIVDYLQLMHGGATESRQVQVAEFARGLKLLARELRVPVLALAQLNRGVEHRNDKRPGLADLRESGEIENAADVVAFLYRDDYYDKASKDAGLCEVIVGKNRHGPTTTVKLFADLRTGRWSDVALRGNR